jgi:hypothetical protein
VEGLVKPHFEVKVERTDGSASTYRGRMSRMMPSKDAAGDALIIEVDQAGISQAVMISWCRVKTMTVTNIESEEKRKE